MHLFWEHGYEGASLLTLREAMGDISSASFYAAFGSKEALYRETLARYLAVHGGIVGALCFLAVLACFLACRKHGRLRWKK